MQKLVVQFDNTVEIQYSYQLVSFSNPLLFTVIKIVLSVIQYISY